jgi:hypothetical protein
MSAIAWDTIEPALATWVRTACALGEHNVAWSYELKPRPHVPFASLTLSDIRTIGHDWMITDDAPLPAPGEELRIRARGVRSASFEVQLVPDGAVELMRRAAVDLVASVPLFVFTLDEAGIAIEDIGPVRVLTGDRGSILEPRAIVEFRIGLASELESRTTYIERVNIKSAPLGIDLWIPDPPPPES